MILPMFIVLLVLSIILITLGFFKSEHSELSIIGFIFMFLLALTIINGEITYKSGETTNISYSYLENSTAINNTQKTMIYNYDPIEFDGNLQHLIGYWLAIVSAVGFGIMFYSLRKTRYKEE